MFKTSKSEKDERPLTNSFHHQIFGILFGFFEDCEVLVHWKDDGWTSLVINFGESVVRERNTREKKGFRRLDLWEEGKKTLLLVEAATSWRS